MAEAGNHLSTIWLGSPQASDSGLLQSMQQALAGIADKLLVPEDVDSGGVFDRIERTIREEQDSLGELVLVVGARTHLFGTCVRQLLAVMEDPSVGIAAPASSKAMLWRASTPPAYHTKQEAEAYAAAQEASGKAVQERLVLDSGCFVVRRAALAAVGGFERAFRSWHYGLPDFCLRLRTAGWGVRFVPSAYVHEASDPAAEAGLDAADAALFRQRHGLDCLYSCNTRPELLRHVRLSEASPAVLEAGCACGGNLLRIQSEHPEAALYGIELSEASAAVARQFAQVYALDVEDFSMPEWEGRFDAVICGDLLEHLRDPWQVVRNFCRITRPGGRIIISVPNVMHISNLAGMLLDGNWAYQDQGIRDRTHLRFFTKKTACELVKQGGYHVAAVEARVFAMPQELHELCDKLTPLLGADVGRRELEAYQWVVVGERS